MLYRIGRALFRFMFTVFFRMRAIGMENVPSQGAVVLCGNHTSLLDPPFLGTPLRRKVHFMAKAELFDIPVLGSIISKVGAFPVKRGGVSRESIRLAVQLLRDGNMLGVFPEGSRSNAGGMGKKGAASLALKSGATVVPVAIVGTYSLFRRMTIVYGAPMDMSAFAGGSSEDLEQATEAIMKEIRRLHMVTSKA
ncbi:acyl-phosphate glycerol 3-phosphate acyltransferase [Paenibacillus pectinilyticus]|uniref:Acyl-phosphate glycerol 3-phosphate acyltransferase n=1 Tax=Paenibacillus pectinilyticus TaxID=512399 RepID=A0A1C0ZWP4_9BACL|nr:lysophospholipid acyltransferase family protein [Paenibacillus pectinilyticus]OCT12510.1 acyl-phosphate glycerol 3-phosphate acyltransferase [Paenibacillus pectinilyticus]